MTDTLSGIAVFPGQGSQFVGMGKMLFEDFKIAREIFEEASDAARVNLKHLCFDGPMLDLTLTENTQPCLLAVSVAAFRVAQTELGFQPLAVAGHSLGEYSALVAAGTLSLSSAARWVKERGAAMQKAVPAGEGAMAAVMGITGDENTRITEICREATEIARTKRSRGENADLQVEALVQPANFNSPGQIVIAGSIDGVAEATALLKSKPDTLKAKVIPLTVSAPFHCALMKPARDRMQEIFGSCSTNELPKTPICPYIPNRTARITTEKGIVFELLIDQIDHPVLWSQSVATLFREFSATKRSLSFFEFGPGKVLQGLIKRGAPSGSAYQLFGVGDTDGIRALTSAANRARNGQAPQGDA